MSGQLDDPAALLPV